MGKGAVSEVARTLPLSPQATTVTYRCWRRIEVSSTNSRVLVPHRIASGPVPGFAGI